MPPKGRKHTTTAQHRAVLEELKARKEEAKKMLADLRAKRKMEDKRHSRLVRQAKKLNPKDLLEIAAVTGITAEQLQDMASRMASSASAPAHEEHPVGAHDEPDAAEIPQGDQIIAVNPGEFPLVLADLPDA
jgi:phage repressor protein C with HTH and peptisase S24 domain